jgi:uncharacterized membrane protein YhaH (DUF805 family)
MNKKRFWATCGIWTAIVVLLVLAGAASTASAYELSVPFPGQPTTVNTPSEYIKTIYTFGIYAGAILAVLMIVVGGIQYTVSEVITNKQEATDRIKSAIIGLLLLSAAAAILYAINPELPELKNPALDIVPLKSSQPRVFEDLCGEKERKLCIPGSISKSNASVYRCTEKCRYERISSIYDYTETNQCGTPEAACSTAGEIIGELTNRARAGYKYVFQCNDNCLVEQKLIEDASAPASFCENPELKECDPGKMEAVRSDTWRIILLCDGNCKWKEVERRRLSDDIID